MKKIVFLLCLLCSAGALAQSSAAYGSVNNQAQPIEFASHPLQAVYAAMSQERSILPSSTYLSAQGERRASDFAQPESVSLGTIARELKKQHADAKKSHTVWINQ